jgi:hypothetical protein
MAKVNPVQVQKYLKGVNYPISKNDLLQQVDDQGGDESVRATLRQIRDADGCGVPW